MNRGEGAGTLATVVTMPLLAEFSSGTMGVNLGLPELERVGDDQAIFIHIGRFAAALGDIATAQAQVS